MGGSGIEEANSVEVDSAGNIFITGVSHGPLDFGGGTLEIEYQDAFVASYSKTGQHRWSKGIGGPGPDRGEKVAIDSAGNVLLAALGSGTFDVEGTSLDCGEPSAGFFASFTSNGVFRWSRVLGKGKSWPSDMALDREGNILTVGSFEQDIQMAGSKLTSAGGDDIFILSSDANGESRWARTLGTPENDQARAVTTDNAGNVFVTGTFTGELTFGNDTVQGAGESDLYVASYSPAGEPRWLRRYGDDGWDMGGGLVTDEDGNVYVTGVISRAGVDCGNQPTYYADIFLASLSSEGVERWAHRFSTNSGEGTDLALDGRGNLCLTGSFSGSVDFGGGSFYSEEPPEAPLTPGEFQGCDGPSLDIVVACFTETGDHLWSRRFGETSDDEGRAIAFGPEGSIYVTGYFQETVDFGGRSLTASRSSDIFLLQLVPPQ